MNISQILKEDLPKILNEVEKEFEMGGLSDGIYADYAKDVAILVAKRIIESEIERLKTMKKEMSTGNEEAGGYNRALEDISTHLQSELKLINEN